MRPSFNPSLYLVTDSKISRNRPLEWIVEQAILGGVTMVQLREKDLPPRDIVKLARKLKPLLDKHSIPLIINDHIDVALATGAAGVHLGQNDLPADNLRLHTGPEMLIGLSVSSAIQAQKAKTMDIDYIAISAIFHTETKKNLPALIGLDGVQEISRLTRLPTFGIGGINKSNARKVISSGAKGIAVVSAIVAAENPRLEAENLLKEIHAGRTTPSSAENQSGPPSAKNKT